VRHKPQDDPEPAALEHVHHQTGRVHRDLGPTQQVVSFEADQ